MTKYMFGYNYYNQLCCVVIQGFKGGIWFMTHRSFLYHCDLLWLVSLVLNPANFLCKHTWIQLHCICKDPSPPQPILFKTKLHGYFEYANMKFWMCKWKQKLPFPQCSRIGRLFMDIFFACLLYNLPILQKTWGSDQ